MTGLLTPFQKAISHQHTDLHLISAIKRKRTSVNTLRKSELKILCADLASGRGEVFGLSTAHRRAHLKSIATVGLRMKDIVKQAKVYGNPFWESFETAAKGWQSS